MKRLLITGVRALAFTLFAFVLFTVARAWVDAVAHHWMVTHEQMIEESSKLPELPLPVEIRIIPLDDCWGTCELVDGVFVMEIAGSTHTTLATRILIHEWAHALAWGKDDNDHGDEWGKAYAACYRAALEVK